MAAVGARMALQARDVRDDLVAAESLAHTAADTARAGSVPDLRALRQRSHAAAEGTDGLLWRAAAHLPVVGGDVTAVRRAAQAADALSSQAAPALAGAVALAHDGGLLRDGQVDLARMAALRQEVATAHRVSAEVSATFATTTGHGFVRHQSEKLRTEVRRLDDALAEADVVLAQAPAMLGAAEARHYLVAVQNNAEARATGGLVGIVALVTADHGRLALTRTVTDDALHNAAASVPSDPQAAGIWTGIGSNVAWFDANLTPHVPDAARNLAGLWQAQMHQRVDGVVLLDAVVLQHLLVKPVHLGSTTLTQADVVDWVARREYVDNPDVRARKALLRDLAQSLFAQVMHLRTVQPLLDAAHSGHLFIWSAHPEEQQVLAPRLVGGLLPADDAPYLQVVTQNFGGNKLDYYLHRRVQVRRETGAYAVTVTLTNTAPTGLPTYMSGRADHPHDATYAQARIGLSLYAGKGARFGPVVVDGTPALTRFDVDHGLTLATTILELRRGATITITTRVRMREGELNYRQQPLVRPDELDVAAPYRVVGS